MTCWLDLMKKEKSQRGWKIWRYICLSFLLEMWSNFWEIEKEYANYAIFLRGYIEKIAKKFGSEDLRIRFIRSNGSLKLTDAEKETLEYFVRVGADRISMKPV